MNEYVISVLEMEPGSHLGLCDEARQMAKNITKRAVKGTNFCVISAMVGESLITLKWLS